MKKNYEEPALNISVFDDEDDIITMSGVDTQSYSFSAEEQAGEAIKGNSSSSVSVYSVNVNEN